MMFLFYFCKHVLCRHLILFFFFNDTATTEIYTLSLHDALPISVIHLLLHPSLFILTRHLSFSLFFYLAGQFHKQGYILPMPFLFVPFFHISWQSPHEDRKSVV